MACQTFFFFFFQEKQATENGILQIYRHGERGQHAPRTARPWGEHLGAPSRGWCWGNIWFSAAPSRELPIPDRSAHRGPGHRHCHPSQVTTLCTDRSVRGVFSAEPIRGAVVFPLQCSVACSNNKLVAINADAVSS